MDDEAPNTEALALDERGRLLVPERVLRALRAIAEATFSTEAGPPPAKRLDWLTDELYDFLAHAGPRTRFVLRLATFAVCVLAPLTIWRLSSLRKLALTDRVRALVQLEGSRFGAPVLAVKALLCIHYYEHPDAAKEVGFDGRCMTMTEPYRE